MHIAERELHLIVGASWKYRSARKTGTGTSDHAAFIAKDFDEISGCLARHGVRHISTSCRATGYASLFVLDPNGVKIEDQHPG